MPSSTAKTYARSSRQSLLLPLLLIALMVHAMPAFAHEFYVFAHADGSTIRGQAYSRGQAPARDATVTILDPAGQQLGKVTTDHKGKFVYEARFRCDHRLLLDVGQGHGAEYVVTADQLPDHLPARRAGSLPPPAHSHQALHEAIPRENPADNPHDHQLAAKVETLAKQVDALRQRLARHEQKTRLLDLLAGIGCILGITGVAFFFLGVKKKQARAGAGDS